MKGLGHIDEEIMEMLWLGMNKVSGAARSMSKTHRQETLDDYMRDTNWKKTVGIGEFSSSTTIQNSHTFYMYSSLLSQSLNKVKLVWNRQNLHLNS